MRHPDAGCPSEPVQEGPEVAAYSLASPSRCPADTRVALHCVAPPRLYVLLAHWAHEAPPGAGMVPGAQGVPVGLVAPTVHTLPVLG